MNTLNPIFLGGPLPLLDVEDEEKAGLPKLPARLIGSGVPGPSLELLLGSTNSDPDESILRLVIMKLSSSDIGTPNCFKFDVVVVAAVD